MILNCNSCDKKFVVPDNAITAEGRMVQCSSCGNKWKQFPISKNKQTRSFSSTQKKASKPQKIQQKSSKPKNTKRVTPREPRELNLYSPEYLAKKHGITLKEEVKIIPSKKKVAFGFYNSLLLFLIFIIAFSRSLYFFQDFVVQILPATEFYLNYFFESIKNMFEIFKNLISNY
jgi:predicted Zn finger-like uncharacterized protein